MASNQTKLEKSAKKDSADNLIRAMMTLLVLSMKAFFNINSTNFHNGFATFKHTPIVKVMHSRIESG